MSLFGKKIQQGFQTGLELSKIADAHNAIFRCFEEFSVYRDYGSLEMAAWLMNVGIVSKVVNSGFDMNQAIHVQIHHRLERITIKEVIKRVYNTWLYHLSSLSQAEQDELNEVLNGGKAFYTVEEQIPYKVRRKYDRL